MSEIHVSHRWAALTRELDNPRSPVRAFLDKRLASGLRAVQTRYRKGAPGTLLVSGGTANAGTVGTAADWLLRFLIHPAPSLSIPLHGAAIVDPAVPGKALLPAFYAISESLGLPQPAQSISVHTFTGPTAGSTAQPELLARACWAIALFTEAFRAGQFLALSGPLGRFQTVTPSGEELLNLAPDDALEQLAAFRRVFDDVLLPALADRPGTWALGPTFAGSPTIGGADADLIAAGLLIEVKTSKKKPSLALVDLFQLIGYALLDFNDAFRLDSMGLFTARYGYLATWNLAEVLEELSGRPVSLPALREEFRDLLLTTPTDR